MSEKVKLATDEEQQKQREFEAELAELKKKQDQLKTLELLERVGTAEGLNKSYPKMMALIKNRNMVKARLALFNNGSGMSTMNGSSDDGNLKAELEASLKELDAAVNSVRANLEKNVSASNPFREAALKALFDQTHS